MRPHGGDFHGYRDGSKALGLLLMGKSTSTNRRGHGLLISLFLILPLYFSPPGLWGAESPFVLQEDHWAVTEQKFELAMSRLRLKELRRRTPLVLSHGFLVNSRFLDLTEEHSLARYLAQEGFDVWNLSLRGTGKSLNPLGGGPKKWTLDDMIREDIGPVVSYVQRQSGSSRVNWVGFEMGGLLPYGYVEEKRNASGINALVTIATPMTFNHPEQEPMKVLLKLQESPNWRKLFLYLDGPLLGRLVIPLVPKIEQFFYNPENMDPEVKEKFLEVALAPVNEGVLDHITTMVKQGEFVTADGNTSYLKNLARLRIPVLIIGGEKDEVAPPSALRAEYRALKSRDRTRRSFGSRPKDEAAYGHYDLILGKKAKEEVFPLIARWLERRDR